MLGDPPDPQARQRLLEHRRVSRHCIGERCCIAAVMPGDRLHHQGGVGGRAGHGADLVEARCEGDEPPAADPPVGGLEAGDPAEAGGLTDRAARVGADGDSRHVGGHAGGRSAAGAAWSPREIPRVFDRPECRVLVGAAHRELVHVCLADDHGIGLPQPRHHLGVVGGTEAGEHLRGARCRLVSGAEGVLDGDGQSGERPDRLAGLPARVDVGCSCQSSVAVDVEKRVDRPVELVDPVEKLLGDLHRGDVALPDGGHEVDGGEFERLHDQETRGR